MVVVYSRALQRGEDYNNLAKQLSCYADMESRISSIVRSASTQRHKFLNVDEGFQRLREKYETLPTWYTQYRDIYRNGMANLPHVTQITMLFSEFNRSDHYFCSSHLQSMDPVDLTYEKMIKSQFRCLIFILGLRSPCHAETGFRLLSLLDREPDVKKSHDRPGSAAGRLTASFQPERT
ncbi:unnamed protein product [Hymenolepis diminuta]|uniref:Uncharacterized protein n=1 Tax=Hymenolepis diminuta TaxID=6216 RepID=A0A0R3STP8_HYMDI|nr:unnamed protein product [Hymenolepis diminuta]